MTLNKLTDIKQYFAQNKQPYYFVSPTNFNLIDIHNWVANWVDINQVNCFDTSAKHVELPALGEARNFESIEEINLYLLEHPKTKALMTKKMSEVGSENANMQALFLFFSEAVERLCEQNNIDIALPPNELVKSIDNKITTTEIGNEVNVFSVPNALAKVDSYQRLMALAQEHNLSNKLVVQTAFGDSGKTTFFISSEEDYNQVSSQIESEDKVKVMKHINCVGTAIEACATKHGTYVGPLLGELIGFDALTPYKGGWCGNELFQSAFSAEIRADIHEKTERIGNALYQRGYRGYFEVDYLLDTDDGSTYLGELNPRITGISAMTNMSAFCQKTIPLFLFHLLEYSKVEFSIDTASYNKLSLLEGAEQTTSQMVLKHTSDLQKVHAAPVSGVYTLKDGHLHLVKAGSEPTDKGMDENFGYLLRITDQGEYAYKGKDLAIIFLNCQLTQQQGSQLNAKAQSWLNAVKSAFDIQALTGEDSALISHYVSPNSNKS